MLLLLTLLVAVTGVVVVFFMTTPTTEGTVGYANKVTAVLIMAGISLVGLLTIAVTILT